MNDVRADIHLQTGPLASFLFPTTQPRTLGKEDICPYGDKDCDNLFGDLDSESEGDLADWTVRVKHLECKHNFDKCQPYKFYRLDLFLLHLAGSHNLKLSDRTKDVVESCKRGRRTLLEIMNTPVQRRCLN